MKPLYAILAGLVGVLLAVPTSAAPCQSGVCPAPAVVAPAVAVTPLATVLPLYGAGYVGTGSDDETKELLRQLLKKLDELNQSVQSLKDAGPPGPIRAEAAKPPDVFEVLRKNCVSCHSGQKPRGDFSLVTDDGKFRVLSGPDRRSVLGRLEGKGGQRMPPADHKQLTPAELASVKAALADGPTPIPVGKK